jgi:hypothetical protein
MLPEGSVMRRSKTGLSSGWCVSAVFALLVPALCAGKGRIDRIDVTESGTRILSIEGPSAREFTIWSGPGTLVTTAGTSSMSTSSGDFADWIEGNVAPPVGLPVFNIFFLCEACEPARSDSWRCYGVRYAMGASGQGGFIQIPASDDQQFPLNVQTIYRGVEGQWFRASPKWEKLVRPAIEQARDKP